MYFMRKTFSQSLTENDLASVMKKKVEGSGLRSAIPMRVCTQGRKVNPLCYGCESVCCDSPC